MAETGKVVETAKFFAGAGRCSAANKGTEVGQIIISAVPGLNANDVVVTITYAYVPLLPCYLSCRPSGTCHVVLRPFFIFFVFLLKKRNTLQ
jgi:hypothetical protein